MRLKPMLTALTGLLLAGGSVLVAKQLLLDQSLAVEAAAPEIEYVEVYVARQAIPFGSPIEGHMLTVQKWPSEFVPTLAFTDEERLLPSEDLGARRAKGHFFEGELIITSKVSAHGDKVTIVSKLGENTRAISIRVDATTAVGGFVTPGDFVDILLTQGAGETMRAVTILQNVRVIGVDQQSEEQIDQPGIARTITVEVSPNDGQKLALAQKAGTLSLTLRTLNSVEDKPLEMVELRDLLQKSSPVPENVRPPTVTVRRGSTKEVETVGISPTE